MFTASWLIGTFVISHSYLGNLVSIMTIPSILIPINSVSDLVSQSDMGWRIEGGSILHQMGLNSKPGTIFR